MRFDRTELSSFRVLDAPIHRGPTALIDTNECPYRPTQKNVRKNPSNLERFVRHQAWLG